MTDDKSARPANWTSEWMLDEMFWRDVATRTIAGTVAGIVVAALTAATGALAIFFASPQNAGTAIVVFLFAVIALGTLSTVISGVRLVIARRTPPISRAALVGFAINAAAVVAVLTVSVVAFWPMPTN